MVIKAIKSALENMDKKYCELSQIYYSNIETTEPTRKRLAKEKYLERPFAYEFYHQLRKLTECGNVDFGGPLIQAEVDKTSQHYFEKGKIPDFIIHVPNASHSNFAVIEFKLATNLNELKQDFKKLVEFKENEHLKYTHAIEVIIGDKPSLRDAKEHITKLGKSGDEEIIIIEFNTGSWKANDWKIRYS